MHFDEAQIDLGTATRAFFFYPQGLKDAIEVTLCGLSLPNEHFGIYGNYIMTDLEQWLEAEYRVNTVPYDLNGLFTNVKIAAEILDEYVRTYLQLFFGPTQIKVLGVEALVGANMHYIVTVEFN